MKVGQSSTPKFSYVRLKAACLRRRPPPGDAGNIEELEREDRYYLLHQASQLGPVFSGQGTERSWVCIIGLARCRRFLQAHAKNLHGYMHALEPMVPGGALRRMEGEIHRKYRKALLSGIQFDALFLEDQALHDIVSGALARYEGSTSQEHSSAHSYIDTLNEIATASLIRVFFGVGTGQPLFNSLLRGYQKLGPFGLVWNIGTQQTIAFAEIRKALLGLMSDSDDEQKRHFDNSIAGKLAANHVLDDTLLGNLIYMVEMGRYDLAGLFRWLSRYGAAHPHHLDRLASESREQAKRQDSFAHSFVLETLRTDKSERLTRIVERDLLFEGYLIPRDAYVRLCLWEAHHEPETFVKPFDFNPERFMRASYGLDQFAPFGLDHHLCPLADISIRLCVVFLWQLATRYRLQGVADGLPVRGAYHWEPALDFSVVLQRRSDRSA
jgi:cytochrome P450